MEHNLNINGDPEYQNLYGTWPENDLYYSQLGNYIGQSLNGEPSISLFGLRSSASIVPPQNVSGTEASRQGRTSITHNSDENQGSTEKVRLVRFDDGINCDGLDDNVVLAVVDGIPSPSTIQFLAMRLRVQPELLIGHLELDSVQDKLRSSFELPALLSRRQNLVHVRLVSLWRTTSRNKVRLSPETRKKVSGAFREYTKKLFKTNMYGSTRIRGIHLHDSQHITIEQVVSFCLLRSGGGIEDSRSICLFMLDKGAQRGSVDWVSCLGDLDTGRPTILPAVRYNEPFLPDLSPEKLPAMMVGDDITHQYHPYLECNASGTSRMLRNSPIIGLYSLLSSAALSWNQVLNYIEDDVDENQDAENNDSASEVLAQIRFNVQTVHRFGGFIGQILELIQALPTWAILGSMSTGTSQVEEYQDPSFPVDTETMRTTLIRDYQSLVNKCRSLVERCEANSNVLQSAVQLGEAHRSQEQTREVNKLSRIIFVFAPLSFIASIFGMNVAEITPGNAAPSLWQFGIAAFIVLLTSLFISYSNNKYRRLLAKTFSNIWWKRNSTNRLPV